MPAQRHDDCRVVLHRACAVGRCVLRSSRGAWHAHDRRQVPHGPERARGAARHGAARLRRIESADRALAWQGPRLIRGDTALRDLIDARTDADDRSVVEGTSGHLSAIARVRESRRGGAGAPGVSGTWRLTGYLRSLRTARYAR